MAFFRQIFDEVAKDYPAVQAEHSYVDAMTMFMAAQPGDARYWASFRSNTQYCTIP
jgi:isocitrate/isopropylmalate dehydrogenase